MRLKSLELINFRGFDQLDINFDDRITVIAGVNGVGKSTILQAIATASSHALPEYTASREKPLSILSTDIQQGKSTCIIKIENDNLLTSSLITTLTKENPSHDDKLNLEHKHSLLNDDLAIIEKGSTDYKNIKNEINWIERRLNGNFDKHFNWLFTDTHESESRLIRHLKSSPTQPLAIYYSTHRLLSKLPPSLKSSPPLRQAAAFTKSLTQLEISLNDFAKWHRAMGSTFVLRRDSQHYPKILELLRSAVSGLMPQIKEFWFHEKNPPRYSVTKDATIDEQINENMLGKQLFLEQLSDGERGLIALVFDLTRRLAIANPNSENPIAEGVALVLIDEIELHLHPKWQRDVLKRLSDTFLSCQFVVTTHSPLVLGEVEARCVRFLSFREGKVCVTTPTEAYGMDANRVLQELMGASVRNHATEVKLHELFELIDKEDFAAARALIVSLEHLGKHEPELARAAALIHFLEGSE